MELSRRHQNEALENPMKKFGNAAISRRFREYVSNTKRGSSLRLCLQKELSFSASLLS
jgi:hypothetical protein